MKKYFSLIFCIIFIILNDSSILAREFRTHIPIRHTQSKYTPGYTGQIIKAPDSQTINNAVNILYSSYNTPQLESKLAPIFYDKSRLLDSIDQNVPKDASMRVLSIDNTRILGQSIEKDAHGNPQLVSQVSVIVRAQMEFNNSSGFQRREGTNELTFKMTQPYTAP